MKIKPINRNIAIEPFEEKTSGILIPTSAEKSAPMKGKVIAVSNDSDIKEGVLVLFSQYAPNRIKFEDKDLYILSTDDVLAIIE